LIIALEHAVAVAAAIEAVDADMADFGCGRGIAGNNAQGVGKILSLNIADGDFRYIDTAWRIGTIGRLQQKTGASPFDDDVADGDIPDIALADTDPESADRAVDNTVGDSHILADAAFIFQSSEGTTQSDAVVTCANIAIADYDAAATVNINAVSIAAINGIPDFQAADEDILAAMEQAGPAAGVAQVQITHPDISALAKHDHLARPQALLVFRLTHAMAPGKARFAGFDRGFEESLAIPIDATWPGDGDIADFHPQEQMRAVPLFLLAAHILREGIITIVIIQVAAASQNSTIAKMQLDVVAQPDAASDKQTGRNQHSATTRLAASVYSFLNRNSVKSLSIAQGTKISDHKHFFLLFRVIS